MLQKHKGQEMTASCWGRLPGGGPFEFELKTRRINTPGGENGVDKGTEMEKHETCPRDSEGDEEALPLLQNTSPDSCRLLLRNQ